MNREKALVIGWIKALAMKVVPEAGIEPATKGL
jgi:hypothetical protein